MQISLLALQRLMMFATSAASFLVHRVPSESTTRRALAPAARMAGMAAAVCEVYQVCAWLTPRATNGVPSRSTSWVPDTCRPGGVAAWAAVDSSDVAPSATTAAARAAPDSRDLRDLMGLPRSVGGGWRASSHKQPTRTPSTPETLHRASALRTRRSCARHVRGREDQRVRDGRAREVPGVAQPPLLAQQDVLPAGLQRARDGRA